MKKHTVLYSALTALLLTFGTSLTANAGGAPPPAFAGFVWDDLDGDALKDPGEPGLAGILINICNAPGFSIDCNGPFATSFVTDANGEYSQLLDWSVSNEIAVSVDLAWPPLDGYTPTTDTVLYFDNTFGDLQGQTTQANFGFQLTPVPVPAAAWLFGSGLLGLAGLARRNRRS